MSWLAILKARETCIALLANFCQKQITSSVKDSTTGGKLAKKLTETANRNRTERPWLIPLFVQATELESKYWREVLRRMIDVIVLLSARGLTLRGHSEIIGSFHNGNFLGIIELLGKCDAFLGTHIEQRAWVHIIFDT